MRLDHLSFAACSDGLDATTKRLSEQLGASFIDGGVHPRFGTRNRILPLNGGVYLEVVEALDHPASDRAPFGQAVRARSEQGGGWLGWVVAVDDLAPIEERLGRESVQGNRHRPDGHELRWRQLGVRGLQSDPQLPFFVYWESDPEQHPSVGGNGTVTLQAIEIGGDPHRVSEWLGQPAEHPLDDVEVEWVAPNASPGINAVIFNTAHGVVRI